MNQIERLGAIARSRLPVYARRLERAMTLIDRALEMDVPSWGIAFSGGKDSLIVLDLVRRRIDCPVYWLDDGWDYPETLDYLRMIENYLDTKLYRVRVPISAPYWRKCPYPGDDPSYSHPIDLEWEEWAPLSMFIGLRAEESSTRRERLSRCGEIHFDPAYPHWQCCPLARWQTEDVWAYIISNGLPYNPVYDKLAMLGVPLAKRRVGPLTAFMQWQASASIIRQGWPNVYSRMLIAFPEIARLT